MKIIKSLLILTCVLFFNLSFSQQKTPYQNKIDQIHTEYFRALHIDESLILIAKKSNDWSIITKSQEFSYAVHSLNKNVIVTMTLALEAKIKDAAKLKNATDFKNDTIKKEKEENDLKLIELKKKEALVVEENRLKKIKFENSDYNNLNINIKSEFSKWLEKSEFEKKETYINRVQNKSKSKFDSICYNEILKRIDEKGRIRPTLNFEKYNPEEEYFNLTVTINDIKFSDTLKVAIADAENLKSEAFISELDKRENDWCLINNEIYPKFILLKNYNKTIKKINLKNENEIPLNYSSKDLNITNEYLGDTNFEFNFKNYKNYLSEEKRKFLEEKAKQDSILKSNIVYDNPDVNSLPFGVEQKDKNDYSVLNKFRDDIGLKIYNEIQNNEVLKNEVKICEAKTIENSNKYDDNRITFIIKFIVEKDGSISNATVDRNNCPKLVDLVTRLLTETEKWKPGMNKNEIVRTSWSFDVSVNSTKQKKKR